MSADKYIKDNINNCYKIYGKDAVITLYDTTALCKAIIDKYHYYMSKFLNELEKRS